MHLLVDIQALQSPDVRQRGIGRYVRALLAALRAHRPEWRIEAVLNTALPPPLLDPGSRQPGASPLTIHRFEPLLPPSPASREANERYFGDWICARSADALLQTNIFEGEVLAPRFASIRPVTIGVAYDVIPLLFHPHYLAQASVRARYGERLQRFAELDHVLAISERTRRDVLTLMRWPASRVTTILGGPGHAGDAAAAEPDEAKALADLGIRAPFVLCVGGADRRKNLTGAVTAFAALPASVRSSCQLVIACDLDAGDRAGIVEQATQLRIGSQTRVTGFVSDEQLAVMYRRCRVLFFPSFYEGLGLPVLEALLAGAPVVASDRSSIPEFAGRWTHLADPASPAAMSAALARSLLEPRDLHAESRKNEAAAFTWAATATRAADAVEGVAGVKARHLRGASRRLRIAWVSPLPPTPSGISDYSADLLRHLSPDFSTTVVVAPGAVVAPELATRYPVLSPDAADEEHRREPFDLFVYHLGNSQHHTYMLDLVRQRSGLIVLHDLYMGGLALQAHASGRWPGDLALDVAAENADALAEGLRRGEADHARIAADVRLIAPLLAGCDGVIVHSGWSWRQVRDAAASPVFRVPMGIPIPSSLPSIMATAPSSPRAARGLPETAFVIATLGEVTPDKRVDVIIRAAAALPERARARLCLVVVGDVGAEMRRSLVAEAEAAGVAGVLRFTGRVPIEQLAQYARAADVCVQLRQSARGETSAAVLRILAAGGACIVSDAGSLTELPPDVALKVPATGDTLHQLTAALLTLHEDDSLKERLRTRARAYAATSHRLEAAAAAYAAAITLTIARRRARDAAWLEEAGLALARCGLDESSLNEAVERWAAVRVRARVPAARPGAPVRMD